MPTQSIGSVVVHDIQELSRVKTKGWMKNKRLGAELDKSIKKSMQKRKRKPHPVYARSEIDNDYGSSVEKEFETSSTWNASYGGGFMSLLNSFGHG
ncbi:hypothetical protein S245_001502 [Arachis hypogaea]